MLVKKKFRSYCVIYYLKNKYYNTMPVNYSKIYFIFHLTIEIIKLKIYSLKDELINLTREI